MKVVLWFSLIVGLVSAYSSVTDLPDYDGQLQDCTSSDIQAACDGDFQQNQALAQLPAANIWVESVKWAYENNYIVTIRYQLSVPTNLGLLTRLQVVGLLTPNSYLNYKVLYDSSSPLSQLIDDASDWGFTYMTSTQPNGDLVCQENFEIEYTWCQADQTNADGCDSWKEQYGDHQVYLGGCPPTLDFPQYCWKQNCEPESSSSSTASSSTSSVETSETSGSTEAFPSISWTSDTISSSEAVSSSISTSTSSSSLTSAVSSHAHLSTISLSTLSSVSSDALFSILSSSTSATSDSTEAFSSIISTSTFMSSVLSGAYSTLSTSESGSTEAISPVILSSISMSSVSSSMPFPSSSSV